MKAMQLVLLLIGALAVGASNIQFHNNCGGTISVYETGPGYSNQIFSLGNGGSATKGYGTGASFNIKSGSQGKTLGEFSINSFSGLDFYDLSVIVGYDVAMKIQAPNGGYSPVCTSSSCGDAYLYPSDNSKTRSTGTGGTYILTFCP